MHLYTFIATEGNAGKSKWRKWPNCSIYRQYAELLNLHFSSCLLSPCPVFTKLLVKASTTSVAAATKQHEQNRWQIPFSSGVVCKSGLVWRLRLMAYSPCDETLEWWASICWRAGSVDLTCSWRAPESTKGTEVGSVFLGTCQTWHYKDVGFETHRRLQWHVF